MRKPKVRLQVVTAAERDRLVVLKTANYDAGGDAKFLGKPADGCRVKTAGDP